MDNRRINRRKIHTQILGCKGRWPTPGRCVYVPTAIARRRRAVAGLGDWDAGHQCFIAGEPGSADPVRQRESRSGAFPLLEGGFPKIFLTLAIVVVHKKELHPSWYRSTTGSLPGPDTRTAHSFAWPELDLHCKDAYDLGGWDGQAPYWPSRFTEFYTDLHLTSAKEMEGLIRIG
jgi:hypothetical protein